MKTIQQIREKMCTTGKLVFFGSTAAALVLQEDQKIETAATDGTTLFYNPEFVAGLTEAEQIFVVAHEAMHCTSRHMYRRGSRDHDLWNCAGDYFINALLKASGLAMPSDCLYDPKYDGLSTDEIYAKLKQEQNSKPAQDLTNGQGSPSKGCGGLLDPSTASGSKSDLDWQITLEQSAAIASKAGHLPAAFESVLKQQRQAQADWRQILRQFIEPLTPSDYSWQTPDRRQMSAGLIMPGISCDGLGSLAVGVDTSGSMSDDQLAMVGAELNAILADLQPDHVTVYFCDTVIQETREYSAGDSVDLKFKGRGGTAFKPVFEAIEAAGGAPACLLYFTDLESYDKPDQPSYPVLWITPLHTRVEEPFGSVVRIP